MKTLFTIIFLSTLGLNNINAATFSSVSSGTWSAPATWNITGADADGIPDSDDDVTINGGHTVTMITSSTAKYFINIGVLNSSYSFQIYGNFNNQGSILGNGTLGIRKNCIFTSTAPSIWGAIDLISGNLTIQSASPVTTILLVKIRSGYTLTNFSSNLTAGTGLTIGTSSTFINKGGAVLTIKGNGGTWAGTLNATEANNTVVYTSKNTPSIFPTTYYNLTLQGGAATTTRTLSTNLTVLNDFTMNNVGGSSNNFDLGTRTLNVGGDFNVNAGSINAQNATVVFNGTTIQSLNSASNIIFKNLILNNSNGLVINSAIAVSDILTVTNGDFNSNGNVTLVSDVNKTAVLAPVGASGSFSGSMTIQKFITTRSANYHDLSSAVSNSTIMDWDDELYMSGIGPYDGVAGPAGVDGNAGTDNSVYNWNEPTGSWQEVTGSSYPLAVGKAYEIFIADNLTSWAGRAIDTKGTPNYGSQTVNVSYTGSSAYAGLNLIGNPFAASIDYASCSKTNVSGSVLILDDSGNYNDYGTSPIIPSNQGFWVSATSAGSVTFLESAKTTNTATAFNRSAPNYGIKLVLSSPTTPFYHENTVNFESNTTLGFDIEKDALFIKSPNKNAPALFMLTQTDSKLITNTINSYEQHVTIPLGLYTPKTGIYYIEPSILNSYDYNYFWIENIKTGAKYDLDHTITIEGNENETNTDYVIHLSKVAKTSETLLSGFENDIVIFNTENAINLKSYKTNHQLNQVLIYDLTGKLILELNRLFLEAGKIAEIDITSLAKGLYIVKAISNDNQIISKKIIR